MLSSDRQSYWVFLIAEELFKNKMISYKDRDIVIRAGGRAMQAFMRQHNDIEKKVRQKISSLKRNVNEHSSEWQVLYWNYYEEELSRSRLS